MINSTSIKAFLKRPLQSYDWMKGQPVTALDEAISELKPIPKLGKLWLHQKSCFLLIEALKRFMLHTSMGGGKALPVDELVLTPNGWLEIGKLGIGDFVIGSDGLPTRITGVFPQGKKPVFNVTFSDKAAVRCCEDHLWAVRSPDQKRLKRPYEVKALKDIIKAGLRNTSGNWNWFIPMVEPVSFPTTHKLLLDPYFLGVWLGDGCRKTTSITSMDPEIIEEAKKTLPKRMCVVKHNSISKNQASNYHFKNLLIIKKDNSLKKELKNLGLYDKYSYERFIPKAYLFASIEDRLSLIQGLMDTDGYVEHSGKCYFDSSSRQLAVDFVFLIRSLGGTATLSDHKENSFKGHSNIYFHLPKGLYPCRLSRKVARFKGSRNGGGNPTRSIRSIVACGPEECTCISVEAKDGLFVTKDFIVTHNTLTVLSIIDYCKQRGDKPKAIIFVPYITAVETWVEESKKHTPALRCIPLLGSTKENQETLTTAEGDLFVICYQSAVAMLSEPVKAPGKRKKKWHIDPKFVRKTFSTFNILVMDEVHQCFPAGVQISTINGPKAIEEIKTGDLVFTGLDFQPVKKVFERKTDDVFSIVFNDGTAVHCTPNHPFLTEDGWVKAKDLKGLYVYKTHENMCTLSDGIYVHNIRNEHRTKILWKKLFRILADVSTKIFGSLQNRIFQKRNKQTDGAFFQKHKRVGSPEKLPETHAKQQSSARPINCCKNIKNAQGAREFYKEGKSRWKWKNNHSANETTPNFEQPRLENRSCNQHELSRKRQIPSLLQSRSGKSYIENSNRVRWARSQKSKEKEFRLKERFASSKVRVVSVSPVEQRYPVSVFNFEVEQHPYYFANGVLVHNCKNIQSLTFKLCRAISAQSEYVVGLTGTPFGRDLLDLWPQFYLIDFGETLGETLGLYRETFFTQKDKFWGGVEYKFQKKMFNTLKRMIKNASIRYGVDEFADMPPKKYIIQKIQPHEGIRAYADKALQAIKSIVVKKSAENYRAIESEYMRLRQLSSGFMTLKGEDNNKLQIKFDENPKLDALQALIEEMPEDCKAVVFHHFVYSNELISERLKGMKIKHARVYGKSKDPIAELRRFKSDPDCRVLVINSKSGSSSLNLQNANYLIFYEQPSAIDRQQAESRCYRPGQERRTFIYDLLMASTVDEHMHKWNKEGKDMLVALLDGTEKL